MDGQQFQNKHHGDIMLEKARDVFYVLYISINKKRARCGSVMRALCIILKQTGA